MAKKTKATLCKRVLIKIKKKSGRVVATFHGRKGGSEHCGAKKPSAAQKRVRAAFRRASKACPKKFSEKRIRCMQSHMLGR